MKNKEFDCVELQRTIRESFWNEAKGDLDKLDKVIDNELSQSELFKKFKDKIKRTKEELTTV